MADELSLPMAIQVAYEASCFDSGKIGIVACSEATLMRTYEGIWVPLDCKVSLVILVTHRGVAY